MHDARGHFFDLSTPPQRIVSLVPSQTELLAALGLDAEVVGLTRFCVHPADWKTRKPIVGGTKQVTFDRVQTLAPDLILANKEENTQEMVEALDALAPVFVTDVTDLADALAMIRHVGALVHRAEAAEALAVEIEAHFAQLPTFAPLRAAYLIWRDPYMSVGHDTFIHAMMARAGFANVFGDQPRYPAASPDALVAAHPDVVLLSSEPYPFQEKHLAEIQALLPQAAVCLVDGELFSWYGSRLLHTPAYLAALRTELATAAPA